MNKLSWILLFITVGLVIYGICTAGDVQNQRVLNSKLTEIELMEQKIAENSEVFDRCTSIQETARADNIVLREAVETKKTEVAVFVGLIKE